MALKREDARLLGLYGDRIGDVVYAVSEYYGGTHGQLPTARDGIGSLRGLLVMAGAGLKRGYVLTRTVHATDIMPTVCHLTGLPVPKDAEGGIIYQALEEPRSEPKKHVESERFQPKLETPEERTEETYQVES